jgi:hypothetical protein
MAGSISQNPAEMTVGEYISENLNRMDPKSPEYTALKNFYDTQVKGQPLANKYTGNVGSTFKDMFEKASKVKFGELHAQPQQTQMQEPGVVTEARKSFVNSDRNKVTNEDLSRQVNNIQKFDNATAAGKGKNTEAAKQAQEAIRDSRKVVNENKKEGVANIPETDTTSDSWYTKGSTGGGATDGNTDEKKEEKEEKENTDEKKEEEKPNNLNKLLLADILMTGVKNALHYRPAFRTAYGEDIEGQEFGTEKSLAEKLAEENMKRGLERYQGRKDAETKAQSEIDTTKAKGKDYSYRQAAQDLAKDQSPITTTESSSEASSNALGSTQKSNSRTNTSWNNIPGQSMSN